MAIVVEEEKNRKGVMGLVVWALIILIMGVAVYYLFFKRPELVEVATPANFRETAELSKISLAPEEIIGNPNFQALKLYTSPLSRELPPPRVNPFLAQ